LLFLTVSFKRVLGDSSEDPKERNVKLSWLELSTPENRLLSSAADPDRLSKGAVEALELERKRVSPL
jgi:hypothetical protein